MNKGLFIGILIIVICVLVMLGIATLPYYTDIEPQYIKLGNSVYDFTNTFENITGFFAKIGEFGRTALENIGLFKPIQYEIFIATYTDNNNNYAYLIYYMPLTNPIKQGLFGIPVFEQYYYRIYAYSDYEFANTFNTNIEVLQCKYFSTNNTFVKNNNWTNLAVKIQLENQPQFETGPLSDAYYTYELVSIEIFDFNMIDTYDLKIVK